MSNDCLNPRKAKEFFFAKNQWIIDGGGVVYWPAQQMLIVADMHLEKASYLAEQGQVLPLHDTRDTLFRLHSLITNYRPKRLLTLGDNFHDPNALKRMTESDKQWLKDICSKVEHTYWILGNHDKGTVFEALPNVTFSPKFCFQGLVFSHDVEAHSSYQIVGHYHPKIYVKAIAGKCLILDDHTMILPAFGSFTGGLDINSIQFKELTGLRFPKVYMLYKGKVWQVRAISFDD